MIVLEKAFCRSPHYREDEVQQSAENAMQGKKAHNIWNLWQSITYWDFWQQPQAGKGATHLLKWIPLLLNSTFLQENAVGFANDDWPWPRTMLDDKPRPRAMLDAGRGLELC